MQKDVIIILGIISILGEFIFIKGFQSHLGVVEIFTIFTITIWFMLTYSLICTSIINSMDWIFNYLLKK